MPSSLIRSLWPRFLEQPSIWTTIEYLWLSTAALGALFAFTELERLQIEARRGALQGAVVVAHREALHTATYVYELLRVSGEHPKYSNWFYQLRLALELGADNSKWRGFLAQNDQLRKLRLAEAGVRLSQVPQFPTVDYERIDRAAPPFCP